MTPTTRPPSGHSPSSPADTAARRTALFLIVRRAVDYPAAHSMDTVWYAVDANGAVGVFNSAEPGPVPKSAVRREHGDVPRLVRILGGECDDEDFDLREAFQTAAGLGLYVYEVITWESDFVDTYERIGVPERPLHLDQLPPKLRKNAAKCMLPMVDFAKEEELQIIGLVACDLYWDEAVGCFAPGHTEVRPIPGKEKEYQAALPQLRSENPDFRFADLATPARPEPQPPPQEREDS
jgi:hypothetical protein